MRQLGELGGVLERLLAIVVVRVAELGEERINGLWDEIDRKC